MSIETTPSNTPDPEWEQLTATLTKDHEPARVYEFEKRPRPAWMMSGRQLKQWVVYARDNSLDWVRFHAGHSVYYLGWSVRGYRRLCLRWWLAHHDDYRQQIASAKQMLRAAKGKPADEARFKALVDVRRAEFKAHKNRHWIRTGICGVIVIGGSVAAAAAGSWWVQLLLALAFVVTGAYFGRPDEPTVAPIQAPTRTSHLGEETMRRVLVEAGAVRLEGELAAVTVDDHVHRVRAEGGRYSCTCLWWAKYRGGRGPCKHALAVRIAHRAAVPAMHAVPAVPAQGDTR